MKKKIALCLALILTFLSCQALASTFVMAGFDGEGTSRVWDTCLFFSRMEERTGTGFAFKQFTSASEWADAKASMAREPVEWDVLFKADLTDAETISLYEAGVIVDLKPYIGEYMPNFAAMLAEHPEWEQAITLPDGAIVALPSINRLQYNNAMWINSAWLDKLGLSVPGNAEELTEVLRAFRDQDPNGNGKADEVPLSVVGLWDLLFLSHAYGVIANDYGLYQAGDGTVRCALTEDSFRSFLQWLNVLWNEKLISHEAFITTDAFRQVTDAKAVMTYGMFLAPTPMNVVPAAALDQYVLLQPMTCDGKQIYRDFTGDVVRGTMAITSHCSDIGEVLAWADCLYTEEGSRLAHAGLENVEYDLHSDGSWSWISANEEVTDVVIPGSTLADGLPAPGLVSDRFQLAFDHSQTRAVVSQLAALKEHCVLPVPVKMLNTQDRAQVNAIQSGLAPAAQLAMARFVVGEVPLDDENWDAFCRMLDEKGIHTLAQIFERNVQGSPVKP